MESEEKMWMIGVFFGSCVIMSVLIGKFYSIKDETKQMRVLKWAGVFFLMLFMINSEGFRVKQAEMIEEQQRIIAQLKEEIKYVERFCLLIQELEFHKYNIRGGTNL